MNSRERDFVLGRIRSWAGKADMCDLDRITVMGIPLGQLPFELLLPVLIRAMRAAVDCGHELPVKESGRPLPSRTLASLAESEAGGGPEEDEP